MKIFKKILCTFLVIIMCLTSAPLEGFVGMEWPELPEINFGEWFGSKASATDEYTEGYYTYTVSDSKATITAVDKSINGDVTIPSTLGGYNVTSISSNAFAYCDEIKNIDIPTSVKSIGDGAFQSCSYLENVSIEYGLTYIGWYAFSYCRNLTRINIPSSVTDIGIYAFLGCGFTTITLPKSLTTISGGMFYGCDNLINISIPDSVTSIGIYAFYYCRNLINVSIPDSVTTIEKYAFTLCSKLENITVDKNNRNFCSDENGVLYNIDKTELLQYPVGSSNESYKILDGVIHIREYSFALAYNLKKLSIPISVTKISEWAFAYCENLVDVYYAGSEEKWNEIEIHNNTTYEDNTYLLEANRHYNSNGPTQNESMVIIDFSSESYEVEVDDTVKIYAKVTCNNGIENLDMVWDNINPEGVEIQYQSNYENGSETEWVYYAGIKGLKEGTYYINLRDNNSTVFDTVKIIVNEYDEPYHPSTPSTPSKPQIVCDNTTVESYQNAFLGGNWNTFKITGEIANFDQNYNLEDIWITIKSPDVNIIKFNSDKESEVTFPLGRSITAKDSDTFKCKAYVNRDYMPEGGTNTLTLTCILNGKLNGKQVEGVYTTFKVKVINLSYKEDTPKPNKTVRELLEQMKDLVDDFEKDKGYYIPTGLDFSIMAVESAIGFGNVDAGLDLANMAYDLTFYLAGITNPTPQEFGKLFLEQLSANTDSEVDKIIDYTIQSLKKHPRFNEFVEWCCKEYGIDVKEYDKFRNNCPTDIIVTDEFGDIVLEIINDEIRACNSDIFADVYESKKTFYLPTGIAYEIKIIATDDGVMDYFVETATENGDRRIIEYKDMPIKKDETYLAAAPADVFSSVEKYNPMSENGTVIESDNVQNEHKYDVVVTASTCTEKGYITYVCNCGESYKEEISLKDHIDENDDGYCDNCGEKMSSSDRNVLSKGQCGDNAFYTLYSDGELVITGTGAIYESDYSIIDRNSIWNDDADEIKSVVIEEGITEIGEYSFKMCSNIERMQLPNSLVEIHDGAFSYCDNLSYINIPDNIKVIRRNTFNHCSSLKSIKLPNNLKNIEDGAFEGSGLAEIELPYGFSVIDQGALSYCEDLKKVTIPNTVTKISEDAFRGCYALESIVIPDSVTTIEDGAFYWCIELKDITMGQNVETIGSIVFTNCWSLEKITIPSSVKNIGHDVFTTCYQLKNIIVDNDNAEYSSDDGVLFNKDKTVLIQYPIGNQRNKYKLPETVKIIGNSAFESSTNLETIEICEGVEVIERNAFSGTTSLVNVSIPDSVIEIKSLAFAGCEKLKSVTIGKGVKTIDGGVFAFCINLTDIYFNGSESEWNSIIIDEDNKEIFSATIHFLDECEHNPIEQTVPSSCTVAGMKFYVCSECGEAVGESQIIPAAHTPGEWDTVIEPTYEAEGKKIKKCTVCGVTIQEATIPKLEKLLVEDKKTGVGIEYPSNKYAGKVEIKVEESFGGTAFNILDTKTGAVNSKIYDIKLLVDGNITQPNGKVTVKIPLPTGYNPKFSFVYYVNSETGALEKMNAVYVDGYMVFETDHFSYYAVIVEPDVDNCSCKCHSTNFITKLIWKITLFFNKLLRRNKECACGILHY